MGQVPRVRILIDEETTIDELRVYGSPWQPWFHDWAYNFEPGPGIFAHASSYPQLPSPSDLLRVPVYSSVSATYAIR
ncbi:MAG: hypothetical protein JO033_08855 [Acidobacteriaceae bacterium]|nr:hypothetical protein [Acidobacteriaceae bacterium]